MTQKVLLVPTHRAFYETSEPAPYSLRDTMPPEENCIRLTPQMLEWTVINYGSSLHQRGGGQLFRHPFSLQSCLKALLELEPFNAAISLIAHREDKTLELAKCDWCQLYLLKRKVAEFTFMSFNEPYYNFLEWAPAEQKPEEWRTLQWRTFFLAHIKHSCEREKRKAQEAMEPYQRIVGFNRAALDNLPAQ